MRQMIRYEPEKRITAAQALEHPWLATFYDPADEPGPRPQVFTRWRDIETLETVEQFRDAIWNEIQVRIRDFKDLHKMTLDHYRSTEHKQDRWLNIRHPPLFR